MSSRFKISLFLFLVGILSIYAVIFKVSPQKNYTRQEILGENTNLTLFIEPEDGKTPLVNYINGSQEIFMEMYILSDQEIITKLSNAQILLEQHPFGGNSLNQKTKKVLGDKITWSNPSFTLTHAKFMVFDNQIVCILNMNLTKTAFIKNREYNICSQNPEIVGESKNIFLSDRDRKSYTPKATSLVVSPDNARDKLAALINSARNTLDIEMEVLTDPKMLNLLAQKSKDINVRVITPKKLKSPYIHAKLIIADRARAYVGSVNLTTQSLDQNRELGILVSAPEILDRLETTFEKDWQKSLDTDIFKE